MRLPNVIIAGGTKCGSTSLFYWLGDHPEVCPSKVKETHFFYDKVVPKFNAKANIHQHGLDGYARLFESCGDEKLVLEATPQYMFQKTAIEYLPNLESEPKVIFLLREPVKRIYSQFLYNKHRLGHLPSDLNFDDYMVYSKSRGYMHDAELHSTYYPFMKKWINALGKERVLIFQAEQMFSDARAFMIQLSKDLEIDSSFYENYDFQRRNESSAIRNRWLHNLAKKADKFIPKKIRDQLADLYLSVNSSEIPQQDKVISKQDQIKWRRHFWHTGTQELFEEFEELDVSLWYDDQELMEFKTTSK